MAKTLGALAALKDPSIVVVGWSGYSPSIDGGGLMLLSSMEEDLVQAGYTASTLLVKAVNVPSTGSRANGRYFLHMS